MAPHLLDKIRLEELACNMWLLLEDVRYVTDFGIITIKAGFITDGGSIPRFAWWVVGHPMNSDGLPFFLLHDALFASEILGKDSRQVCDWELLKGLHEGVTVTPGTGHEDWATRNTIWLALKAGSWSVWNKHTKASIAEARKYVSLSHELAYV